MINIKEVYDDLISKGLSSKMALEWTDIINKLHILYDFVEECANDDLDRISGGLKSKAIEILEKIK